MMRALEYLGGYWNSGVYCPWRTGRTGRTRWESASRRCHVHEILLNDDNRAKHLDHITRSYGPSRQDCISLCEDLTKRGFAESRPGIPKCFALTARGKEVIGATAHVRPTDNEVERIAVVADYEATKHDELLAGRVEFVARIEDQATGV